jgi:hypothetical protein
MVRMSSKALSNLSAGLGVVVGLLLASAEHTPEASNWCWLINLSGVGLIALVAVTNRRVT